MPIPLLYEFPAVADDRGGAPPTVSVIMRTRDRGLLLARALDSVIGQTFTDWRLVLVNDGGDPAEVERLLAARAGALGERVTLIHHAQSLGMEAASNAGLAAAAGTYFAIHDDDDTWRPDFLRETVAFLEQPENAGFIGVISDCERVFERIEDGAVVEEGRERWNMFRRYVDHRKLLVKNNIPPITALMRREALSLAGGFNSDLPVQGDWEFFLRALIFGDIGVIDKPLAGYHHRHALMQSGDALSNTTIAGFDAHMQFILRIKNSVLRQALRKDPTRLGLVQPVLSAIEDLADLSRRNQREAEAAFARMEQRLEAMAQAAAAREARLLAIIERLAARASDDASGPMS
jgi:glycosyltransferase involved in cell wall biosynthesis